MKSIQPPEMANGKQNEKKNHTTSLMAEKCISFPGSARTFSFGARLTPLNLASLEENHTTAAQLRGNQPYPPASELEAGAFPVWEGEFKRKMLLRLFRK